MKLLFVSISILFVSFIGHSAHIWNQKASIPAEGRHRTTGFSIGNKGYIGLGHYNSGPLGNVAKADIWEYSPADDSWTQKADYGGGATYGATAFTIGNRAYVGAHVYGSQEFYEFNPQSNTWSIIAPCPGGSSDHPSFTVNDRGYFIGTNALYEYEPTFNTWITHGSTPVSVWSWDKAFSVDGKGYLLTDNGFFEYKPSTDNWAMRAQFPGEAVGGWSCFGINGKGYVATGYISFLNPTSRQTWQYDPQVNEWHQLADLPGSTRRFSASFKIGNKGYLGTGTNGTNLKDFWEFDETLVAEENSHQVNLTVFPNPTVDDLFIQFSDFIFTDIITIDIYNQSGEIVLQQNLNQANNKIELKHLSKGIYFYNIYASNEDLKQGKIILN